MRKSTTGGWTTGIAVASVMTLTTLATADDFSLTAVGEFAEQQQTLILDADVTVQVPDLGLVMLDAALKVDEFGDPATFAGPLTLTNMDGDEITAAAAGALVFEDGVLGLAGSYEITGGTGVYEGVTGNGVIFGAGVGDDAGAVTVQLEGVITPDEPSPDDSSLTAVGDFVEQQQTLLVDAVVTEQVPDLGLTIFDAALKVDETGEPSTFGGPFSLINADGDEISALATGVFVEGDGPQGSVFSISGPYEITGGTGAYEGATGNGVIVGSGAGDEAGEITVFLDGVLIFETPCPADINGDGSVGFADLQELLQAWGDCPLKGDCPADINVDGSVGFADLQELLQAWGSCPE